LGSRKYVGRSCAWQSVKCSRLTLPNGDRSYSKLCARPGEACSGRPHAAAALKAWRNSRRFTPKVSRLTPRVSTPGRGYGLSARFDRPSRHVGAESRAIPDRGLGDDGAAVHRHDLSRDVEPQPEARGKLAVFVDQGRRNLHQRVENHLELVGGNRPAAVLDLHRDLFGVPFCGKRDRLVSFAMPHRIVQEVEKDLLDALGIELPLEVARSLELEDPL